VQLSSGIAINLIIDFDFNQCSQAKKEISIARDACHINDHEIKVIAGGNINDSGKTNWNNLFEFLAYVTLEICLRTSKRHTSESILNLHKSDGFDT
jgi:hypothetical protein